jgi:hypothetical protein
MVCGIGAMKSIELCSTYATTVLVPRMNMAQMMGEAPRDQGSSWKSRKLTRRFTSQLMRHPLFGEQAEAALQIEAGYLNSPTSPPRGWRVQGPEARRDWHEDRIELHDGGVRRAMSLVAEVARHSFHCRTGITRYGSVRWGKGAT